MSRVRRALTQELAVVVPTIERQAVPAIACIAGSQWPNLVLVRDGVKESNWPISAARNVAHDCGNECPRIVVTDSSGSGASAARNEGWRQTKAKWILFLDDDVSALSFGRDELTHALAKQLPSVGVIGLRVLCPSKPRGRQALVDHSVSLDQRRTLGGMVQARPCLCVVNVSPALEASATDSVRVSPAGEPRTLISSSKRYARAGALDTSPLSEFSTQSMQTHLSCGGS